MSSSAQDRRRSLLQETRCDSCRLSSLCLPLSLDTNDLERFDSIIRRHPPIKKGTRLIEQGDPFTSIYAVRSGSLKQTITEGSGEAQLTNFFLPSEIIGLDGISDGLYTGSVVALEMTTVCEIPFDRLDTLSQTLPELRSQLLRTISKELHQDRRMMQLLSRKTADQRLACFFLGLSDRFRRRGYSPFSFRLSMSRADIGNHLGLAVETISRILGRFQQQDLVAVSGREVHILNINDLTRLADTETN
ncbi:MULTISPECIES: fumarate/nitrate reduction transcriptional regulator Fnr [Halomonas]|uniref:Fumarate/nitrate reduction transcriptional regulator Fnr n=1 Tax=Halomonas binhaiensis TaxID=2562282 RepID=A0A5C1NDF5_9GAMM|nr:MULTISPECIES: fumarate/nitrate reduction transcriptional regulator Fnr [Halomonas]QEM80693.1 fumarate/nitrate reduction transcriptional regulator Fnr [Halomonas binhaiensis]